MSQIFTLTEGQGRPLVVLHGWGMNHHAWQPIRAALTQRYQVTWVDLPGHGLSVEVPMQSLEQVVEDLKPLLPNDALIMGWSLGGIIAQTLAHDLPKQVSGLLLVTSTPCFVASTRWPYGLAESVLTGFAENLQSDYAGAVKRFFVLQFMGVRNDPQAVNQLRDQILSLPASRDALQVGLEILHTADRRALPIKQPNLWLLGRLDKLIPASLTQGLSALGYQHIHVMQKAAHMPFVTHPDEFLALIDQFIMNHCS